MIYRVRLSATTINSQVVFITENQLTHTHLDDFPSSPSIVKTSASHIRRFVFKRQKPNSSTPLGNSQSRFHKPLHLQDKNQTAATHCLETLEVSPKPKNPLPCGKTKIPRHPPIGRTKLSALCALIKQTPKTKSTQRRATITRAAAGLNGRGVGDCFWMGFASTKNCEPRDCAAMD